MVVCGSAYEITTSSKNAQGFVRLYDGETKKVLKDIQLPDLKGSVDVTGLRQFGDGSVYLILNKKHLYRIDPSTLDMKEIHGEDYKVAEFSEGFATVEFVYRNHGDGLKVMTNLGKSFVYYPIPNKLYGEKMAYKGYLVALGSSLMPRPIARSSSYPILLSAHACRATKTLPQELTTSLLRSFMRQLTESSFLSSPRQPLMRQGSSDAWMPRRARCCGAILMKRITSLIR